MTGSILSDKNFKTAFVSWWLIWSLIHYMALSDKGITTEQAITDSVISNLLLAGACLLISNNMRFYLPRREKYWYLLIVGLAISGLWLAIDRLILGLIFSDAAYKQLLSASLNLRFGESFLLLNCMSMLSLLLYNQQEQKEMESRKVETEKLSREAELLKLRQQLQPHFLFNSLNSISALTGADPHKARHMIQQLSDFLRGTLRKDDQQWSALSEEIEHLNLYLEIEKVRFGYRLQTKLEIADDVLKMRLPALLLQPIVENAIKFGLYDTIDEVTIEIKAENIDGVLTVFVSNPFDESTAQPLQGTGFGLASIRRRLYLLFARQDLLATINIDGKFITTIKIPQAK